MDTGVESIVKCLVAVAWMDGRMDDAEKDVLDALISSFNLTHQDAESIRDYAKTPHTLEEVPIADLSLEEKITLLQHAVVLTYVDGEQSRDEARVIGQLIKKLQFPIEEASKIIETAEQRAQRLMKLLK